MAVEGHQPFTKQKFEQFAGGGAVLRVLAETGREGGAKACGDACEVGLVVDYAVEECVDGALAEGAATGGGVDEHRAEGEDVAGFGDGGAGDLFGRHESRGTQDAAGSGESSTSDGLGDAEVDDARAIAGDQDVGGLQIAVNHTRLVDGGEGLRQTGAELPDVRFAEWAGALDHGGEVGSVEVGTGHPGPHGVGVGIDDGGGPEAADPPSRLDLLPEALPELRVRGDIRTHHLDREPASARRTAKEHLTHPARTQETLQPVGADRNRIAEPELLHHYFPKGILITRQPKSRPSDPRPLVQCAPDRRALSTK
ncbi:hypothetical protein OG871_39420 [Kitasatospora sp. NBC_00374]